MNSRSYQAFVLEQLGRVTPVRPRRMFGEIGIYGGERFFAILAEDRLYFKVDDTTRPAFQAAGMEPFRPYADARSMNYYEVPPAVLEDVEILGEWVRRALDVAARARRKAPGGKGSRSGRR